MVIVEILFFFKYKRKSVDRCRSKKNVPKLGNVCKKLKKLKLKFALTLKTSTERKIKQMIARGVLKQVPRDCCAAVKKYEAHQEKKTAVTKSPFRRVFSILYFYLHRWTFQTHIGVSWYCFLYCCCCCCFEDVLTYTYGLSI